VSYGWQANAEVDNRSVSYGWQANAEVAHRSGEAAKVSLQIPRTGSRTHTGAIVRVNFASRSEGAPEHVTTKVVSLSPSSSQTFTLAAHIRPGRPFARRRNVIPIKRFVYVLRSEFDPNRYYTGLTSNVAARLEAHKCRPLQSYRERPTLERRCSYRIRE
jgi:hypothetical protein